MKRFLSKLSGGGLLLLVYCLLFSSITLAKPTAYYENADDDNFSKGTTRYIDSTLNIVNPTATKWFNREYYDDKVDSGSDMNYKRNRYKLTVNRDSSGYIQSVTGTGNYKWGQTVYPSCTLKATYKNNQYWRGSTRLGDSDSSPQSGDTLNTTTWTSSIASWTNASSYSSTQGKVTVPKNALTVTCNGKVTPTKGSVKSTASIATKYVCQNAHAYNNYKTIYRNYNSYGDQNHRTVAYYIILPVNFPNGYKQYSYTVGRGPSRFIDGSSAWGFVNCIGLNDTSVNTICDYFGKHEVATPNQWNERSSKYDPTYEAIIYSGYSIDNYGSSYNGTRGYYRKYNKTQYQEYLDKLENETFNFPFPFPDNGNEYHSSWYVSEAWNNRAEGYGGTVTKYFDAKGMKNILFYMRGGYWSPTRNMIDGPMELTISYQDIVWS